MKLAYITTGYPFVSHTFIQNEVLALRALGVSVDTYSVARSPESEARTQADREALATTVAMRPVRVGRYLRAHLRLLARRPRAYLRALARTRSLAGSAPRDIARHGAYFLQAAVLADEVLASDARHIHAHFANVASDLAMLASILSGDQLTWSFTLHGPREFFDIEHHRLAEKAEWADFVICISEFARSQIMAFTPTHEWPKFHVVPCGVDTDRFLRTGSGASGGSSVSIACVGRLVPEKGQTLLIQAVAALASRGVICTLSLVGDGLSRQALEAQTDALGLRESVQFLGARRPDEIVKVLEQAHVFCLPSFAEGVPIVLMEAMAMGLPAVAGRVAGIPELIDSGANGLLVSPGSLPELIDALHGLASDPALRKRLGQAGRATVLQRYSLAVNARLLADTYRNTLESKPTPSVSDATPSTSPNTHTGRGEG